MRVAKFIESYFDAWNHWDARGVADHLADDGVYWNVPENARVDHDQLILELEEFFARGRQRFQLLGDLLTDGNTVAFQYRALASGPMPAYRGAEFMTLSGDAAKTITDFYDIAPSSVPPGAGRPKYAKSGLDAEQLETYKRRLETVMQDEQIFLQSDLTLPKLASAIDCSVNHLSQVINAGFGVSFFDYLNRYRVDHARHLLGSAEGASSAILNIAFAVGFNSNSAFYAAFRKHVGQTPAQYRRHHLRHTH